MIKPPAYLSTAAKRRFTGLARRLDDPTDTQAEMLGLLAQAWENYLTAQEDLATNGINLVSGTVKKKNPAGDFAFKERQQILELYDLLGLIPDPEVQPEDIEKSKLELLAEDN